MPEEPKTEAAIDKAIKEMGVGLPVTNEPLIFKLIALATLAGGLSIVGSTFVDIVRPDSISGFFYILRLAIGVLAIAVAYGIVQKKRWALWLYGLIVLVSLIANPGLAIIPAAILAYLSFHKNRFAPCIFDFLLLNIIAQAKKKITEIKSKHDDRAPLQ